MDRLYISLYKILAFNQMPIPLIPLLVPCQPVSQPLIVMIIKTKNIRYEYEYYYLVQVEYHISLRAMANNKYNNFEMKQSRFNLIISHHIKSNTNKYVLCIVFSFFFVCQYLKISLSVTQSL